MLDMKKPADKEDVQNKRERGNSTFFSILLIFDFFSFTTLPNYPFLLILFLLRARFLLARLARLAYCIIEPPLGVVGVGAWEFDYSFIY